MSEIRKQFGRTFVLALFLAAPAFAQFEIAPDHFNESSEAALSSTAAQLNQEIAKQQAILQDCRVQIQGKAELVELALQSLQLTGNEAGEAEALAIYQGDLEKLQKSLQPVIKAAEAILTRLEVQLAMATQSSDKGQAASRPAKHSALIASRRLGA